MLASPLISRIRLDGNRLRRTSKGEGMQLQRKGVKMHNLKNKQPPEPALDSVGLAPWPHCWPLAQDQMACLVAELLMLQQGRGSCGAGWGSLNKKDGSSGMSGARVSADGGHRPPQPPQRKQHCTVGWELQEGFPFTGHLLYARYCVTCSG